MKKKLSLRICAFFLFFSGSSYANPSPEFLAASSQQMAAEQDCIKRINNHFILHDYPSANQETFEFLSRCPLSKVAHQSRIKALAGIGDERLCLSAFKDFLRKFPDDEEGYRKALEDMAWGIIHKTAASHCPPLRLLGILAAFISQDAKGIALVKQGLRDPSLLIRGATVRLAGNLHDAVLLDEIASLVADETSWKVRVEAMKAAGRMRLTRVRPVLLAAAADMTLHEEERAAAMSSLVQMQKTISRREIEGLVKSDRANMRMLACDIVAHLQLVDDVDLLMPLLIDKSVEARLQVLRTIGLLRVPINVDVGHVVKLLDDSDPLVAITAAWVVTLSAPLKGQKTLEKYLNHNQSNVRRCAAAALAATGEYGLPLLETCFDETKDPYVRLNVSLGLVGLRRKTEAAADAIFSFLTTVNEQIMDSRDDFFPYICPSTIKHDDLIPNAPEAINQKTRLELLNILAMLKHQSAQQGIRLFLQEKKWGITGVAAIVLLTEGDDQALLLVKELLKDNDPLIRLQAALVLALWGEGEDALSILENAYFSSGYEDKEKIIEAVGRVGSKKSLSFLVDRIQEEPHQSLRLIAAAGILQILYQ